MSTAVSDWLDLAELERCVSRSKVHDQRVAVLFGLQIHFCDSLLEFSNWRTIFLPSLVACARLQSTMSLFSNLGNNQNQAAGSSPFGASTQNKPSLFGANTTSNTQQQGGSLFGGLNQNNNQQQQQQQQQPQQNGTSSLFGGNNQPAQSGSIFGQPQQNQQNNQQQQQTGGGLFGGLGASTNNNNNNNNALGQSLLQSTNQQPQNLGASRLGMSLQDAAPKRK